MALKLDLNAKGTLEVIAFQDSALVGVEREDYDEYLKNLDESLLNLEGEPTRFILRKHLKFEATQDVLSQQVDVSGGKTKVNIGYILSELRYALVDIKNPSDVSEEDKLNFKKDSDGYAHKELVNALYGAGVAMDLWAARSNAVSGVGDGSLKKS